MAALAAPGKVDVWGRGPQYVISSVTWLESINGSLGAGQAFKDNFFQAPVGTWWSTAAAQTAVLLGENLVLSEDWKEKRERQAAILSHKDADEHSRSLVRFLVGETKNAQKPLLVVGMNPGRQTGDSLV